MNHKLAVQLYTLREECKADFPGVLRELSKMGWAGVQFAGYNDYDPKELAAVLQETGLKTAGMHVGYQRFVDELDQLVADAKFFGTRDLICPSIPADLRNEEGYREVRRVLNEAAARVQQEGIRISYHNHAFEFETNVGGETALAYLLQPETDNLVLAELDVYWVKKGGNDPVSYIAPYANRMPIIHLKDMTNDEEAAFAEIGTGSIDFKPILTWGEANGIEWYVVEQDRCNRAPMDCVQTSFTNLTAMIRELK
ncbi:MAG: xylose isomerase [Paenibacillaceae bacterium]|jgi:sugar phosphate isomerase/epimerase|nr:xylose isomerase [Paenibacillaceae bacterium]